MNFSKQKSGILVLLLVIFGLTNISDGQEWAKKMFKEFTHSFGDVPLGEIPEHRFEIENIYREDIRIRSVTSSCGCTIATPSKTVLKMWEKGEIICRFNSPAVGVGFKQATITVRFDKPFVGECQLTVGGNITSSVTFTPDKIDFGQVTDNSLPVKSVRVVATGQPNFRIQDVKSTSADIKVIEIREVERRPGMVAYEMKTQLKETVAKGFAQGELYVVVEEDPRQRDRSNNRVFREKPISFSAKVVAPLQVAPEVLTLGPVEPGKQVSQKVFLTSDQPFKITDVRCHSEHFGVKADRDAKKVHIVEVSYRGDDEPGRHECELSFYTDMDKGESSGRMKAIVEIVANKP